jgi:hypothetical protein
MCRLLRLAALVAAFVFLAPVVAALAHSWYNEKRDPLYPNQSCCGGMDCAQLLIEPGVLTAEPDGYRVRLTLEQSQRINRYSTSPIDALIEWERVQPSEDGNYHICIMSNHRANARQGVYCFFAPPNS